SERGEPEQAVRLLGAAEALRDTVGAPVEPIRRPGRDRTAATVRAVLDQEFSEATWLEGRQHRLDEVIAYALEMRDSTTMSKGGMGAAMTSRGNRAVRFGFSLPNRAVVFGLPVETM